MIPTTIANTDKIMSGFMLILLRTLVEQLAIALNHHVLHVMEEPIGESIHQLLECRLAPFTAVVMQAHRILLSPLLLQAR